MGDRTGSWAARLQQSVAATSSLLCVGLDPEVSRFPRPLRDLDDVEEAIVRFNSGIIEATAGIASVYKPNLAFYLAHGAAGLRALERTRALIPLTVPAILDAKMGDMGPTANAYARAVFDSLGFDAVTVNPYLGEDALVPFLSRSDRGIFVLCKTSNLGSGDLQDLVVQEGADSAPLYVSVARRIAHWDATYPATVGLVAGATYPAALAAIRAVCLIQPILMPGVGTQAGKIQDAVPAGLDGNGSGLIASASRAILYASGGADWMQQAHATALGLRKVLNDARSLRVTSEP